MNNLFDAGEVLISFMVGIVFGLGICAVVLMRMAWKRRDRETSQDEMSDKDKWQS